MVIADLGAYVQKVEPPGGVASRHMGPLAHGQEDPDQSLEFWAYNSSKTSRVVDASAEEGRRGFAELLADAHVLIVEDRGWLLALGVDLEDRKSVVEGRSVSVRVDLGGRRIIEQKIHQDSN